MYFSLIVTSCRGIYRKMNKNKEIQNQLPVGVLHRKWFLKKIQNLQEHTCIRVLQRLQHQCFPINFCKIFKNTHVGEHLQIAAFKK